MVPLMSVLYQIGQLSFWTVGFALILLLPGIFVTEKIAPKDLALRMMLAILGVGVLGYAAFFAYFFWRRLGYAFSVIYFVTAGGIIAKSLLRRKSFRPFLTPIGLTILTTLFSQGSILRERPPK